MGGVHGVGEQNGLVVGQRIQELFTGCNEFRLLFLAELARDDLRLVIFQPQSMQQCDQPGSARIDQTELLLDPGTDLARRARQGRHEPGFQSFLLLSAHLARAATGLKARQPFDTILDKQTMPPAYRIVV
jgi:hypothetical protein